MAKTNEELQELKEKVEALSKELEDLTDEEMEQVAGGSIIPNFYNIQSFNLYGPITVSASKNQVKEDF